MAMSRRLSFAGLGLPVFGGLAIAAPLLAGAAFALQGGDLGSLLSAAERPVRSAGAPQDTRVAPAPWRGAPGAASGPHESASGNDRPPPSQGAPNAFAAGAPPGPAAQPALEREQLQAEPEVGDEPVPPFAEPAAGPAPGRMAMAHGGANGFAPAGSAGGGSRSGASRGGSTFASRGAGGGAPGFGSAPFSPSGSGQPAAAPASAPAAPQTASPPPAPFSPPAPAFSPASAPGPSASGPAAASAPPANSPATPIVLTDPAAPLKGNGPVGGPVVIDGGRLAAGNSPGRMEIPSLTQLSGTLEVEIFGTELGEYDRYIIDDTALFSGGAIEFVFGPELDMGLSFSIAFLFADEIIFDGDVEIVFSGLDFDASDPDLFDVFVEADGPGRERLVLSYFAPLAQQPVEQTPDGRLAQAPEPESLLLFGLALLGLAAGRRAARAAQA